MSRLDVDEPEVALTQRTERRGRPSVALHMVGLSLLFVAAGMLASAGVDLAMRGDAVGALLASSAITAGVGVVLWRTSRVPPVLAPRAVFSAVGWSWLAMAAFGALPFLLSGTLDRIDDAWFESVSGFTCSGSTVLTTEAFETTSAGVMWWRQLTHWFGGMGVIVLAVAVLPFLGVGGLELIKAEAPGPTSDRLAPRVSETAKRLWLVYLGFTAASTAALLLVGLDLYEASAHALALVSTGGFSTEAASIGAFDSAAVEVVVVVGMIIGGASFTLHWDAVHGHLSSYWRSSELRTYLAGIVAGVAIVALVLVDHGAAWGSALRHALFNVVTLATSCGFGNAQGAEHLGNFVIWAPAAQIVLLAFMWMGGMTGSTSGGVKVLRAQVMGRIAWRELLRSRHPRVVAPIRQGRQVVPEEVVARIAGFVLLYVVLAIVSAVLLSLAGTDPVTALSGTVSAMGNMGPALGEAGPTSSFLVYSAPERMLLSLLMLVGRLEVFPMILALVVGLARLQRLGASGRAAVARSGDG